MSKSLFKSVFNTVLLMRALAISCVLLLAVAASPRLGTADIPELPMPDGSGDTPEMFIDLFSPVGKKEQIKLSSLRGRVVLLDFFYSKCPHCEEHAPHIAQLYNQYRQRGFTVLGLATDRPEKKDDVENVKTFVNKAKITYPVGFLTTMVIAYYMDSHNHGVPQMVLFGPDGKMVKREIGWSPKIEKEMREAIEAQLAKLPTVKPGSKASAKPAQGKAKQA